MSEDAELERMFFELASENRLIILHELQKGNLKMQEIARRLGVTATEAFRQLERLSAASLVQRQPDGTFALAEYGKLVLQISTSLYFITKHKDYFSTHDLMRLPGQFVDRLGELSSAELIMDTIKSLNMGAQAFTEAEQYIWGMGEDTIPEYMVPVMNQRIQKGIQVRMLIPEDRLRVASTPDLPKNVEMRSLHELPAVIAVTEKAASVCFRQIAGRMDYAGFGGGDSQFHDWVRDMFLYYWDKGKRK
jgi:predicted transcriptional regulator